ncbi:helix-turn-helix domain-containing protein [Ferrovum sp.]|uniref:helix-turn-helix domain-containing protein n=1 Tax=Ferrovum sp. TaxID=2609467 RepID=UPI00260F068D|nr:helix-turn-helix domain-containing protein [Ferrovum sp.]
MPSKKQPIFPSERKLLSEFGERLRLARLRRKISAETLAERSSISRMTLHRAEQGSPAVSMGTYLRILAALHLQDDIGLLAADDKLGRRLQDIVLDSRKNA